MCTLHTRFPHVVRMHFEQRTPTPIPPGFTQAASPPVQHQKLQVGDVVVYLSGKDQLVKAQVCDLTDSGIVLDNGDEPSHVAKLDPACFTLLTPLQPAADFVPL